jgi:Probable cobalt transporter subunit (CbtA)
VSGLLLRGLFAGVLAGFLAASFSHFAGEPPLERALVFEAAISEAGTQRQEPEIMSRKMQRGAGLFSAHIVYGAAIGGLFSLVFAFGFGRMGSFDPQILSALLAALSFVALVLVPDLKYPANPPAIGAAETIGARTALYFALLAISLLAMILAVTLALPLAARLGAFNGVLISAAAFALVVGAAALALPAVDEVPEGFPASVLWNFRVASLSARAVFWSALGLSFGGMAQNLLCGRHRGRT